MALELSWHRQGGGGSQWLGNEQTLLLLLGAEESRRSQPDPLSHPQDFLLALSPHLPSLLSLVLVKKDQYFPGEQTRGFAAEAFINVTAELAPGTLFGLTKMFSQEPQLSNSSLTLPLEGLRAIDSFAARSNCVCVCESRVDI